MFFFNDTATTEIYTLSLHDALPIFGRPLHRAPDPGGVQLPPAPGHALPEHRYPDRLGDGDAGGRGAVRADRKSTRLHSSHANISYAVFFLKKIKQLDPVGMHADDAY